MIELRPHQTELKQAIYAAMNDGHRRIVAKAPTGFGKTHLAAKVLHDAVLKGHKGLFLAPKNVLVDQSYEAFKGLGLNTSVLKYRDNRERHEADIFISTPQTAQRRLSGHRWLPQMNNTVLLLDECHEGFQAFDKLMPLATTTIGLTATPWRHGMQEQWDTLVESVGLRELIDHGWLCDYRLYVEQSPNLLNAGISSSGDYSTRSGSTFYDDQAIADIAKAYLDKGGRHKAIGFCVDISDAKRFADAFSEAGIRAEAVHGDLDKSEAATAIQRLKDGHTEVLFSVVMLTAGLDIPSVTTMLDCQPTLSKMRYIQKIGRVLRTSEGKEHAIILDFAGNATRIGLPCDPGNFPHELLPRQSKGNTDNTEPAIKTCPNCHSALSLQSRTCSECGYQYAAPPASAKQIQKLVEVERPPASSWPSNPDDLPDSTTLVAMLLFIAKQRDYQEGWVKHAHRHLTGWWPLKHTLETPPINPTAQLTRWVQEYKRQHSTIRQQASRPVPADSERLMSMLRWMAKTRDYKVGWAKHKFVEIAGRDAPQGISGYERPCIALSDAIHKNFKKAA